MKVLKSIILNKRVRKCEKNNVFENYRFSNESKYRNKKSKSYYYKRFYLKAYFAKMFIKTKISI